MMMMMMMKEDIRTKTSSAESPRNRTPPIQINAISFGIRVADREEATEPHWERSNVWFARYEIFGGRRLWEKANRIPEVEIRAPNRKSHEEVEAQLTSNLLDWNLAKLLLTIIVFRLHRHCQ